MVPYSDWTARPVDHPGCSTEPFRRSAMVLRLPSRRGTFCIELLAPDIVKAAIDGTLPHGMGVVRLADPPAEWSKQHQMIGLSLELNGNLEPSLCKPSLRFPGNNVPPEVGADITPSNCDRSVNAAVSVANILDCCFSGTVRFCSRAFRASISLNMRRCRKYAVLQQPTGQCGQACGCPSRPSCL
jgi:hypothetical protein